jgi:Ras-related protein Rab-5C
MTSHQEYNLFNVTTNCYQDSFDKVRTWVSELREKGTPDQIIVVVGNKTDLPRKMIDTAVNTFFSIFSQLQEAQKYANENNLLFMETSAKEGTNVEEVFRAIGKKFIFLLFMLFKANKMPSSLLHPQSTARVNLANSNNSKSGCPC